MSIQIFRNAEFKGTNATLTKGKYPVSPIGDDKISSIKVEPGSYAIFFLTKGFRDGSFVLFAGDYPTLGGQNDKIGSIQVFDHDPHIFPMINFFTDANFKGIQQNLAPTEQVTNYDAPFIKHNVISSVKVPEGISLTLFKGANQTGSSITLDPGEYSSLSVFGFNDGASSAKIVQNNLEVVKIEYVNQASNEGEPVIIQSTAQNSSSLQQQVNLTLETAYEETLTRSFSNSTLFGMEISTTTTVGVELGPVSASVEHTVSTSFENTFTFGEEESKTKTISISKGLDISIPPHKIAKAIMTLTPQQTTLEAIYTLRLKGTDITTKQHVLIESRSASVGTVVIDKFTPIAE